MREALGARNDAHLAELLGYTRANVATWKRRGKVPDAAKAKLKALAPYSRQGREAAGRYEEFSPETRAKGLCLAIYLAPSLDAVKTKRFSEIEYGGVLDLYAGIFQQIRLACTEEVAQRMVESDVQAVTALESLVREDTNDLYDRVLSRAMWWRYGSSDK